MKTRTKKLVSMLLTFVMLLGMIPTGAIVAFAEGTNLYPEDGNLTIDTNATEYVIKGPEDWATVSAASATNDFAGKKVTLGVDLGSEQAPLTLAPLFTNVFFGEFNGNGKVISNVTVNGVALIAAKTKGVGVSIHDLTVKNSSVTATQDNGTAFIVAAVDAASDDDMTTLKNITVEGCTLTSGAFTAVGALVGRTTGTYYVGLTVDSCKVTNTTLTTGGSESGLMIGKVVGGVVNVTGCEVSGTVSATTDLNKVGGMIGYAEAAGNRYLALTVSNTKVNAALTSTAEKGTTLSSTGVMLGLVATGSWSNAANVGTTAIVIDGCTVEGSIYAPTSGVGGVAGIVKLPNNDDYSFTVKNTDVNVTLENYGSVDNSHFAGMGSVVGNLIGDIASYTADDCKKTTQGSVLFENVNVRGTLKPVFKPVGGVIGAMYGGALEKTVGYGTDVTVSRCDVAPSIIGGTEQMRGGIVGYFGAYGWNNSGALYMYCTGAFDVVNTRIATKVTQMGGALGSNTYTTGGVIGLGAFHGATVKLQNCVVAPEFDEGVVETHDGTYAAVGLIAGRMAMLDANAPTEIIVQNCVTSYAGAPGKDFYLATNVRNLIFNGVQTTNYTVYSDDSLCQLSAERTEAVVKRDANNDIISIGGVLAGGYLQTTNTYTVTPEEGEAYTAYAVRFIALSQLDSPKNAGILITVKDAEGNVVKTFNTLKCEAYDTLSAYGPDGSKLPAYNASNYSFGASKFIAVVIEDIPTGSAYSFEVTPHYTTEGGMTVMGETRTAKLDANGVLTNAIG